MLGGHDGDADIDVGATDAQPGGAVLRQPPFGNVKAGDNLDARDNSLRQYAGGGRHRPQNSIDSHTDNETRGKRFDVDIACPQLNGFFQEIVDRTHHRRAAGKIAQTFDVVFAQLREAVRLTSSFGAIIDQALIQRHRQVV